MNFIYKAESFFMVYKDGLYELRCGENDFIPEKVAVINGIVHQDSDPLIMFVDVLMANLDEPTLRFIC